MIINFTKHCAWFCPMVLAILLISNSNLMAHGWVAPKEAAKTINPVPQTQASIDKGQEVFAQFCAQCHGENGQGLSAAATKLKKDAPNLPERLTHHSDGDFHWKIKNGKGEMPSFKEELSDNEIWDLINYIKSKK